MENVDKVDPVVLIDILGEELPLKYSIGALKQFKKWTGKVIHEGVHLYDPEYLSAIIYCGLIGANPDRFDGIIDDGVPEKRIADYVRKMDNSIEFHEFSKYIKTVQRALAKAQPSKEAQDEAKKE